MTKNYIVMFYIELKLISWPKGNHMPVQGNPFFFTNIYIFQIFRVVTVFINGEYLQLKYYLVQWLCFQL